VRSLRTVLVALGCSATALAAQSPSVSVELSADTVAVAEVFELRLRFDVPPGSAVYFADTLSATTDVESFAPVEWSAQRADGNEGAVMVLTYRLIPFGNRDVALPTPDVVIGPVGPATAGEDLPGGSIVAEWADAPPVTGRAVRRLDVPEQRIWIDGVQFGDDFAGNSPKGPDDVLGTSWSWPNVALIGFFSSILATAGVTTSRRWLLARRTTPSGAGSAPSTTDEARRAALAEIERLLAAGPYEAEREKPVYAASSDVLRGYAARLASDWVPGLTSSELMSRFARAGSADARLAETMALAERVKFGRLRTGSGVLEAHLGTLRDWLRAPEEGR
jgi:hypothetical protein